MLAVQAMHPIDAVFHATSSRNELLRRNGIFESPFEARPLRLAEAFHEMSRRILAGGRNPAFGVLEGGRIIH